MLVVLAAIVTVLGYFWPTPAQNMVDKPVPAAVGSAAPSDASAVPSPAPTTYHGGYGPERDTFTSEHSAPYAVLNSITDNPDIGDERNFVRVKLADSTGNFGEFVRAKPGDQIELLVCVFDDASDGLAGSASTIHGLYAKFSWPSPGTDSSIGVTLGGKNATQVWDGATIISDEPVSLSILSDSATMRTNAGDFNVPIVGDYVSELPVGWSSPDGEFPVGYSSDGKYRGSGYLTLRVEVNKA
ncbi:hypothetical protein [Subtercola frigoramans]|uniref:Secreted protein n=1 Tax=Subtercola frigoramans TaxID=120298 RepID=A0ABS2L637_9MICO|nr:hypothetical protein [Subtercola frigoramans]MBM7472474.1 hypothetical protein [Subtercola frigoramans]